MTNEPGLPSTALPLSCPRSRFPPSTVKTLHWDAINPFTGRPFTWDDPNLRWGRPRVREQAPALQRAACPQLAGSLSSKGRRQGRRCSWRNCGARKVARTRRVRNRSLMPHTACEAYFAGCFAFPFLPFPFPLGATGWEPFGQCSSIMALISARGWA